MDESAERYSFTRLETFRECPRKYLHRYVERREPAFETIEAVMGRVVHACLAWLYLEREARATPTSVELGARFAAEWAVACGPRTKVVKRGETADGYFAAGREMLLRHYHGRFADDCLETLGAEVPFTIRLSGRRLFAGVVDRLARHPDGSIVVVDYKTTRRPPRALDDELALQLRSYGVYALIARRTDLVRLEYQYLSTGAELNDAIGPREANEVVHRLTARIDLIAAARSWMPKPSALCVSCGYSQLCSAATASSDFGAPPDERETCPRCGGRLVPRSGRRGPFLGCAHFPTCRFTRDL